MKMQDRPPMADLQYHLPHYIAISQETQDRPDIGRDSLKKKYGEPR